MQRRRFLTGLTQALAALGAAPALARATSRTGHARTSKAKPLRLQDSRIAGSQYYDYDAVLDRLHPGDPLQLRRQPGNPHDPRAIEVLWRTRKLGYLPCMDNATAASLLDRAHGMHAEILGIDDPDEEWEPISLRLWIHARHGEAR